LCAVCGLLVRRPESLHAIGANAFKNFLYGSDVLPINWNWTQNFLDLFELLNHGIDSQDNMVVQVLRAGQKLAETIDSNIDEGADHLVRYAERSHPASYDIRPNGLGRHGGYSYSLFKRPKKIAQHCAGRVNNFRDFLTSEALYLSKRCS
jgi:hypothetical protein